MIVCDKSMIIHGRCETDPGRYQEYDDSYSYCNYYSCNLEGHVKSVLL